MRTLITILLLVIACNCQAQRPSFDTTLNVVSNGAHWVFKARCDSNIFNYAAWDSVGTCMFTMLIPNVPVAGRTGRGILADSLKAIKTKYNLTLSK